MKAYEAANTRQGKDGGEKKPAVARKKRLHVLGGAVMRSWGAVQVGLEGPVRQGPFMWEAAWEVTC